MLTTFQWLISLRPALPMSIEKPCIPMSNGELKRCIIQGAVLINSERFLPEEPLDFPVFSLVFFPKSSNKRTTII